MITKDNVEVAVIISVFPNNIFIYVSIDITSTVIYEEIVIDPPPEL